MHWTEIQSDALRLLSGGLHALQSVPPGPASLALSSKLTGNYLIYEPGPRPVYAGEALIIGRRLRQQFAEKSSFYKNYCRAAPVHERLPIHQFSVGYMGVTLGRKELEEFAMANLTLLNTFRSKKAASLATDIIRVEGAWEALQMRREEVLKDGERHILQGEKLPWSSIAAPKSAGIYFVYYDEELIYIGESSDLSERHRTHSKQTYFSALRRHIGTELLGLQFIAKKRFSDEGDLAVTALLQGCFACFCPVALGRMELEEHLIAQHRPLLNRKGRKAEVAK